MYSGDAIRVRLVELISFIYPCNLRHDENYLRIVSRMFPNLLRELDGGAYLPGDPFLVYVGPVGISEESIRMMVLFDGMQDLRTLQLLTQYIGHEKVVVVLEKNLTNLITFSDYQKKPTRPHWRFSRVDIRS